MSTAQSVSPIRSTPPKAGTRLLGFQSLDEELQPTDLPVRGRIPTWLSGRVIRATPALLDVGGKPIDHWFDGLAMLHKFAFRDGAVSYANRFVDTPHRRAAAEGRLDFAMSVGTKPTRPLTQRLKGLWDDDQLTFAPNINVVRTGDRYLASTEHPLPYEFDPETLETKGRLAYQDKLGGQIGAFAHAQFDPRDGSMVTYSTSIGVRNEHRLFSVAPGSMSRQLIAAWPAGRNPIYMHSLGLTERHAVMMEKPLHYSPVEMIRTGMFNAAASWKPEEGTPFRIIDRATGAMRVHECEPFFYWHTVNAFEQNGEIVVDVVAADSPKDLLFDLGVEKLRDPDHPSNFAGYLTRFRVPVAGGRVRSERICDVRCEFPQINFQRCNTNDYRYAYMVAYAGSRSDWFDELIKVDVTNGQIKRWSEDGCYTSEPMFAPAPGGAAEDDGVVMSIVLDSRSGRSFLLVLDGSTFAELARAEVPHHIPFNFHQQYLD